MSDVAELLERVKAATGTDRDLDYAVSRFVDGELARHSSLHLPYTASIDAALALTERVLPGFQEVRLQLSLPLGEYCNASIYMDTFTQEPDEVFVAPAKTAPLAILAATLSAIARATGETP